MTLLSPRSPFRRSALALAAVSLLTAPALANSADFVRGLWPQAEARGVSRSAFESRQKTPNGWGLHDMLGNVREWTGDWYGPYPGTRAVSPTGPGLGSSRVTRGGGWRSEVRLVRFASREPLDPFGVHDDVGFRPVRTFGWGLDAETSARALWLARERP